MTPMIDVLLVLIIIFMVITPLAPKGLPASLSREPLANDRRDDAAVVVEVEADGSLRVNQRPVLMVDLAGQLREIYASRAAKVLFVKAAGALDYWQVLPVVDLARGAGIDHVGLLTK